MRTLQDELADAERKAKALAEIVKACPNARREANGRYVGHIPIDLCNKAGVTTDGVRFGAEFDGLTVWRDSDLDTEELLGLILQSEAGRRAVAAAVLEMGEQP